MAGRSAEVRHALGMVAVVVGADVLVFRHFFWARLVGNIGIVMVFLAFYMRYQAAIRGR